MSECVYPQRPVNAGSRHHVAVCPPPGEYAGNEDRWELDCDVCGYIGSGESETEAWEMAARHSVGPAQAGCNLGG